MPCPDVLAPSARECPRRDIASPDAIQPWRRLRLQDRAGGAARDHRQVGAGHRPEAIAGRHRDLRRRRGLSTQRARRRSSRRRTSSCRSSTIPIDFGAIAATNALSDVYAMGATPLFALALVGMPIDRLPVDTIRRDSRRRRGGLRQGRHSRRRRPHHRFGRADLRPGGDRRVDPRRLKRNVGARAGRRADPRQAARCRHLQRRAEKAARSTTTPTPR